MPAKCELKAAAKARGETRYLSRTPCKRHGSFIRLTSTGGCVDCAATTTRNYRRLSPVRARSSMVRSQLKAMYGLSAEQYEDLLAAQDYKCKICSITITSRLDEALPVRRGRFASHKSTARVDHDHTTGTIRGLLCSGCNVGLGQFRDDEMNLLSAVRYLRESATAQEDTHLQDVKLQGEKGPRERDPDQAIRRVSRRSELSPFN